MNMRYTFLLTMLSVVALAWSQNPSPSTTPQNAESRPPNQKAKRATQQPTAEQRGSEKSPFIIKILPSDHTQNESQANRNQRPTNPSNLWGLSDKIAVIASVVAFLQFAALAWT